LGKSVEDECRHRKRICNKLGLIRLFKTVNLPKAFI
jgi:hypothetical protein